MQSLFALMGGKPSFLSPEWFPSEVRYFGESDISLLLDELGGWDDPNPEPVLQERAGVTVLRDDLLEYGSKIRFIDYLIQSRSEISEWVYGGGNPYGYGPVSLAYVCRKYNKKATSFMAERKQATLEQQKALRLGSWIEWVPNGRLSVCGYRAKRYVEAESYRSILPMGLWHPLVVASIIKVARSLPIQPKEVWLAAGSGTLSRGLQLAWPEAHVYTVQIGHKLSPDELGRATLYKSQYKFNQECKEKERPSFPSATFYDAKVWQFVTECATKKPSTLFWNVA